MSFTTKKYTRPVLVAEIRKVNARQFTDVKTFANAFSPRAGVRSAKLSALRSTLRSNAVSLNDVFNHTSGAEAKKTLISLIRNG